MLSTSANSATTNSRLPILCSDDHHSSSSAVNITSASCSPWQSGLVHGVSRNEREETHVKSTSEPDAVPSLHLCTDPTPVDHHRSCEPPMPCYVTQSDAGSADESLISLRSTYCSDSGRNVSESRLSRDGLADMTVADASPEQEPTSTRPGFYINTAIFHQ